MNEKQWALLVISPMIVGTGVLLWRQRALSGKSLLLVAIATAIVSGFMFTNFH